MKNNFTRLFIMLTKFTLYGFFIQCFAISILLAFDGNAQGAENVYKARLAIGFENASLENVFKTIEKHTVYKFAFDKKDLDKRTRIELNTADWAVSDVLLEVSKKANLAFKQINNTIYVLKKEMDSENPEESLTVFQSTTVTGTITANDMNEPLPGVNIVIKGTSQGTVSDVSGKYSIEVPGANSILVFSSVGYIQEETTVGNRTVVDLSLTADVTALSEIVVVGYGTQERAKVTGAISSVNAEELAALPVPNVAQALQGRAAGVTVTNSGSPGVNPIIRIRGVGTVNNNDPLFVIDGMPAGGLNEINPNDIESVEILKDASTAAIYGSRAANGVVLITTKKGVKGKARVNIDSYYGVQTAWRTLDLLNREQYLDFGRELLGNAGDPVPARFNNLGDFANVDTDWQNEMFRTASIQDHNLSISGGTDNATYNVAFGYFAQDGIMLGTDFQRVSLRSNTEFKIGKVFTIGQNLTVSYSDRNIEPFTGGRSQIEHIVKSVPYIPVRDPSRLGGFRATDTADGSDPENPVLNATLRQNRNQQFKMLGNAYIDAALAPGLKYRFMVGMDVAYGTGNQYTPRFDAGGFNFSAWAALSENRSTFVSPLISNQLSYNKSFNKHNIDAIAVMEQQTSVFTSMNGGGQNFLTNDIRVLQGIDGPNVSSNRFEYALISYLGRINYDYDGKYLVSVSSRTDGGSRFGPDTKWGTFSSAALGWRISEENFMAGITNLSDLKIRASYGEAGNDNIGGDYAPIATINANHFYPFGSGLQGGSTVTTLANRDLRWESTKMTNVGIDVGLFNDRFNMSLDWFNNDTEGMILRVPVPPSLGYDGAPLANVGSARNRGVELVMGYRKTSGEFTFSIDGNIGYVNNQLLSLGIGNNITGPQFQGSTYTFTEVGQPIAYFLGLQTDGIFQSWEEVYSHAYQNQAIIPDAEDDLGNPILEYDVSNIDGTGNTAPGDIRFVDVNGDGVINDEDRVNIGHYLPDFTYGLNISANWRNFDFTMFLQGVQGNQILSNIRFHTEGMTRLFNASTAVMDSWRPDNTNTTMPRAVSGDPNNNARLSDRFIEDGSYLRLKNLSIGYTIPASTLSSWTNGAISRARVYVSSQNLFTITNYSGYDPEIGTRVELDATLANGIDYGQFPQPRTIFAGVQISF
ncbi:MAG: SusC/RagA family TonB-linked outer membrane protein [Cyclobacteriaceae bacterium]